MRVWFCSDSFIEVISGLGIAHMIIRIQKRPKSNRDKFERTALRVAGFAFSILVFALVTTTFYGVVISVISILVMWILVVWKKNIGIKLNSEPILADANCTMVCVYMSLILLISNGIYELTSIQYIDGIRDPWDLPTLLL